MNFSRLITIFAPNSTRAPIYFGEVRAELTTFADERRLDFREIAINRLPYRDARAAIARQLADGDLAVVAGGDGLANVALDAVMTSEKSATLAVLPLGGFNDFAHALNGRTDDPRKILASEPRDFYPLDVRVNGGHEFFVAQYITFGAGAKLAEFLNSAASRDLRAKVRGQGALFGALCVLNYGKIFRAIGDPAKAMPPFRRAGKDFRENNVGFMLGAIGGYFHPRAGDFQFRDREFFFHHASLSGRAPRDVPLISSWALRGMPGETTTREKLDFSRPVNLLCQIGGDEITLKKVCEVSATRSARAIKIFAPRAEKIQQN